MIKSGSIKQTMPFFGLHFRRSGQVIEILVESYPWLHKQVKSLLSSDSVLIFKCRPQSLKLGFAGVSQLNIANKSVDDTQFAVSQLL